MLQKFAFLHVPKTAGTSVHAVIAEQGHRAALYPPHWKDETESIFKSAGLEYFIDNGIVESLDSYTAIGGHTDIRLLDFLSDSRFVFTVLRDPFDRLVSFYFHHVFPEKPHH